ncbi:MAG: hypothetical protein COA47_10265 [Robiginitomaculum sp.]|nr:MAG: hypothetical protein COA47_10265 [Robiginitomaculum sp.]
MVSLVIDAGTEALVNALRQVMVDFTDEQKAQLFEKLTETRCDECGTVTEHKCYCSPAYDE